MRYLRLLARNRDFRNLYFSALISFGGDWFLTVALLDLVLEMTGSATLASLMIVAQSLPVFFTTPLAGHLLDRIPRRKLLIATDIIAVFAALLPLFAVSPALLVFGFAGMTIISMCSAIFQPGAAAAVPNLVEPEDLPTASVLFGSTWGTMLMLGAAIGGWVTTTFGRDASFVIDAATFLVSALLLKAIRRPLEAAKEEGYVAPGFVESFREAFRYAASHPKAMALVTAKGGYGFGAGTVAMLSIFGREVFDSGAWGIGLLFSARGVGALVGPFIVGAFAVTANGKYRSMAMSIAVFGLGYIALAFSPVLWIGILAVFIAHLGGGAQWMASTYGLQHEIPDFVRGRFLAVDFGLATLTMSISSILAGLAADRWGVVPATIGTASICLVWAAGWGTATRRLWR